MSKLNAADYALVDAEHDSMPNEWRYRAARAVAALRAEYETRLADAEKRADELAALLDRYDDKTADDAVTAHAARRAARDGQEGTR